MRRRVISTRMGDMLLCVHAGKLCKVKLMVGGEWISAGDDDPVLDEAQRQIEQYLSGHRQAFDLPLDMSGSVFDCAVWQLLQKIPYGETVTYSQLADALGKPNASRAVGGACSRNPLLIVVPCHRVVARNRKLTGFAAGLQAKRTLLALEGWTIDRDQIQMK